MGRAAYKTGRAVYRAAKNGGGNGSRSAPLARTTSQRTAFKATTISVKHSEMVYSLPGSVNFKAIKFVVNPGLPSQFMWVNRQARNYETYRVKSFRVRYVPRVAATCIGSVILSPEYDPMEPGPKDEQEATNAMGASEFVPWTDGQIVLSPAACHANGKTKLVRTYEVAGNLALYDVANIYIVTTGMAGTDVVGKIWVDYEFEFASPQYTDDKTAMVTAVSQHVHSVGGALNSGDLVPLDTPLHDFMGVGPQSSTFLWVLRKGCYRVVVSVVGLGNPADEAELTLLKAGVPVGYTSTIVGAMPCHLLLDAIVVSDGTDDFSVRYVSLAGAPINIDETLTSAVFTLV